MRPATIAATLICPHPDVIHYLARVKHLQKIIKRRLGINFSRIKEKLLTPVRRMPSKNSPTNKTGEKESTMNNEYIIILTKNA